MIAYIMNNQELGANVVTKYILHIMICSCMNSKDVCKSIF